MFKRGIDGAVSQWYNKQKEPRGCRSDQTQIGHDGKEYSAWSGNYVPPVSKGMFGAGIAFWILFILLLLSLAAKG